MYEKLKDMVEGILSANPIDISTINPILVGYHSLVQEMGHIEQELAPKIKPLFSLIKQLYLVQKNLDQLEQAQQKKARAEAEIKLKEEKKATMEKTVGKNGEAIKESYTHLEEEYHSNLQDIEPTTATHTCQTTAEKIVLVKSYSNLLKTQMIGTAKEELMYLEYQKKRIAEQLRKKYTAILQKISTIQVSAEEEVPLDNTAFISFLQKIIKTYKEHLLEITNEGATIREELISPPTTDLNPIKERANTLVKKYFPQLAIQDENLLATEALLVSTTVNDLLTNITTQLESILSLEALIKEYQEAERISQHFRIFYKITGAPSCTPEQFHSLEHSHLERKAYMDRVMGLINNCSDCEKKLNLLKNKEENLKKVETEITKMKKNLKKQHTTTVRALEAKETLSNKLTESVQKIQELNSEIPWDKLETTSSSTSREESALGLVEENSSESEQKVSARKKPPAIDFHTDNFFTITAAKMDTKIRQQFSVLLSPNELEEEGCCSPKRESGAYELAQLNNTALEQWYNSLYDALPYGPNHQVTQLLRDIYFELDNPNEEQFAVLEHYRTLCPNPATDDYTPLLQFKPKIRPEDNSLAFLYDETKFAHNKEINNVLKELYQQVQALQKNHKREALLLNQLTDNLKLIASKVTKPLEEEEELSSVESLFVHDEYAEKDFSIEQKQALIEGMNDFQHDPRYLSLHKHRGFHKITEWFAQLVVDIAMGCSGKPKEDYRSVCFFKPTRTIELIEKATQAIEAACPKINAG